MHVEFPLPFYLSVIALVIFSQQAWAAREKGWGIPLLVVLLTAGAWYPGDVFYNDYSAYALTLGTDALTAAWWEVFIFFLTLGFATPLVHQQINRSFLNTESHLVRMIREGAIDTVAFQQQITAITRFLFIPWCVMMGIALLRTDFDFKGLFFPFLSELAEPWSRGRIGGGFDALYSFAAYLQILFTALFGITLALSKRSSTFLLSAVVYFLAAPYFFFGRTRNTMLAVFLPGFMAFVALRMKGSFFVRLALVCVVFIGVEGWMKFVIDNRDKGSILEAVKSGGTQDELVKKSKHLGFNMFEELGYINYFIANGTYHPNFGERYFAELVNPIPRSLWPGKPMIGIDYAIARGLAYGDLDANSAGVAASVSTGMIGQGVVNFGSFFGPIAAALLMALWVAVLARQDLMGSDLGHLLLYAVGLVLTFNMGRDITLLVLYPFVFGWILLKWIQRNNTPHKKADWSFSS